MFTDKIIYAFCTAEADFVCIGYFSYCVCTQMIIMVVSDYYISYSVTPS